MRLGRLEVIGPDGVRAVRFTSAVDGFCFNAGRSVGEVDVDHFLVRRLIESNPLPGGLIVRIVSPGGAASVAPLPPPTRPAAPPPQVDDTAKRASFGARMIAARARKAAERAAADRG